MTLCMLPPRAGQPDLCSLTMLSPTCGGPPVMTLLCFTFKMLQVPTSVLKFPRPPRNTLLYLNGKSQSSSKLASASEEGNRLA